LLVAVPVAVALFGAGKCIFLTITGGRGWDGEQKKYRNTNARCKSYDWRYDFCVSGGKTI